MYVNSKAMRLVPFHIRKQTNKTKTITGKETRLQNKSVVRNVFLFQFIAYPVDTLGQLLSLASKPECLGTKGWSVSCKRDML